MYRDHLPVQKHNCQEPDAFVRNEFEYYQPPLQYVLCAIFANIFSISPRTNSLLYFCRGMSVFWGMLSIIVIYFLTKNLFGETAAFYITSIYSLLPIHIRYSAAFSNDQLVWVLVLIIIAIMTKKQSTGYSNKKIIFLEGFILGLALWTKATVIPMLFFYIVMAVLQKHRWKYWIYPVIIGGTISSPCFIRNLILYKDLLGVNISMGPPQIALSSFNPAVWFKFFRGLAVSFVFPYDTIYIPFVVRLPAYLFFLLMFILWGFEIQKSLRTKSPPKTSFLNQSLVLMISIFFLGMIFYNWNHLQTESRIIFLSFPPVLICVGNKFTHLQLYKMVIILIGILYPTVLVLLYS